MTDPAARLDAPAPPSSSPQAGAEAVSFWTIVKEAIRGDVNHDFTEGPIGRAILLLAVPMVLEVALESIFAVADIFWVSHLGPDAVASVGLTESLLTVIYALAMGVGIGATALVARRIGEKDPEGAARAAAQALALALLVSLVLGVAGALLAPRLLALMGATPQAIATGRGYAAISMRVLWLANIINIVLGPLLIFGPGPLPALGVTGAAVATTIGRSTGAIYAVVRLFRHGSRVPVARRHLRFDFGVMRQILSLSGSATLQNLIGMASWIGLVRILAGYGSDALAGYTIAVRLIIFALLPSWGLSNA